MASKGSLSFAVSGSTDAVCFWTAGSANDKEYVNKLREAINEYNSTHPDAQISTVKKNESSLSGEATIYEPGVIGDYYMASGEYSKIINAICNDDNLRKKYGDALVGTLEGDPFKTNDRRTKELATAKAKSSSGSKSPEKTTNKDKKDGENTTTSSSGTSGSSTSGTSNSESSGTNNQGTDKTYTSHVDSEEYKDALGSLLNAKANMIAEEGKNALVAAGVYSEEDFEPHEDEYGNIIPAKCQVISDSAGNMYVRENGKIVSNAEVENALATGLDNAKKNRDIKAINWQIGELNRINADASTGLSAADVSAALESGIEMAKNDKWDEYDELMEKEKELLADLMKDANDDAWAQAVASGNTNRSWHSAWDPRLGRLDAFLFDSAAAKDNQLGMDQAIRIPFSSLTVATAFSDLTFVVEKLGAIMMWKSVSSNLPSYDIGHFGLKKDMVDVSTDVDFYGNERVRSMIDISKVNGTDWATAASFKMMDDMAKIIMNGTGVFKKDPKNYGTTSLMNPYSLTKLVGGIDEISSFSAINYMYDIRDRRRFYDLTVDRAMTNDIFAVSNPTITLLILWSNADKWGRTPYSFQDFVYCKYYGIMPTNRLVTLRRYAVPTYDNLLFDSMFGKIETAQKDSNGRNIPSTAKVNKLNYQALGTFAPHATVVTYWGGETGNSLSSFMGFKSGLKWADVAAKVHDVTGEEGKSKQLTIDEMFESGGLGQSDFSGMTKIFSGLTTATNKVLSFSKFAMACNGNVGLSEAAMNKLYNALQDPYGSGGPFENRIIGPVNRIESVKKRDAGIIFEQSFTIKCQYEAKAIGGINPKAALLDILGNCMEMVSPTAVFWGGGHRFMVTPHTYPYHDGGWRDSFMDKLYDGNILGKDGALADIGSGIVKVLSNGTGEINMDNLGGLVKDGLGQVFGAISAGLQSLGSSLAIPGVSDFIERATSLFNGAGETVSTSTAMAEGKKKLSTFAKNQKRMWQDKVIAASTFPSITGMGALLTGEPVGEWHLTVGNPLNPDMVIGNLICESMQVEWNEELGPDDFPTGFSVTYVVQHGMARDKDAIQSMFNKGMGKYYALPDYMKVSSDRETRVDKFTGESNGASGTLNYMAPSAYLKTSGFDSLGYQHALKSYLISAGSAPSNTGNANTLLLTKFTPINTNATMTLSLITQSNSPFISQSNMAIMRSLASNRKMVE